MTWREGTDSKPKGIVLVVASALAVGGVVVLLTEQASLLMSMATLLIVVSLWMMHKAVRIFNLRAVTIPGFFYWVYWAMIVVPAFFVFAEQIEPYRSRYLFAVLSVLISLPLGILVVNRLLRFKSREIADYYEKPVEGETPDTAASTVFVLFLTAALGLFLVRISEGGTIPLIYLVQNPGDHWALTQLREEALKLLDSPLRYVYSVLRDLFFPYLILIAFGRYLQVKSASWTLLFCSTLIAGVLYAAMSIAKSPVGSIIVLLFVFYWLFKSSRIGKLAWMLAPILVFAFPVFVELQKYSGTEQETLAAMARNFGERLFYIPAHVLYYYFEIFPDVLPYQYGATIGKLAWLMGWRTLDIPNFVGLYMGAGRFKTIHANAAFIGNLNADFGLYGVLVGSYLLGMMMQAAQIYLFRKPKTVINIAIYSFLIHAAFVLCSISLPVVLLSGGAIFVFLLAWMFEALESVLRRDTLVRLAPGLRVVGEGRKAAISPLRRGARQPLPSGHD